jgi:hypothetical protein
LICACKSGSISESERENIIAELNQIKKIDQEYAGIPPKELMDKYGAEKAWELFEKKRDSIGLINQEKIKNLYKEYGYLGYKQVGNTAAGDFWITIQHADNDVKFQQQILKALRREIKKGNADKSHYAMLEDRVNVNLNKSQRFGSQLTYNDYGQAIPKIGLTDSINVESLRKEFGLPTFKQYYNRMTIMHFEMNKQVYLEKGITEPKLYK